MFLRDFLAVFGVDDPGAAGRFEKRTQRDAGQGRMDYLWPRRIAIEMKSRGKDLGEAYKQLKEYVLHLPTDEIPDLLMVSDFEHIALHDRVAGNGAVFFKTKDLHKNIRHFARIAGFETTREIVEQLEVNTKAAEKMARLHDALKGSGYEGHELEVYLVRLLFCLFADSAGIFPKQTFLNYVQNSKDDGSDLSERIFKLFETLNMSDETRAKKKLLSGNLRQFRYINGNLFKDLLPSADFDARMRGILIDCCHFDWGNISPAIFGAMFQGIKDKDQRRELGTHYTSEENILKLINPLFMDELWKEFNSVKTDLKGLDRFDKKIASLKFLDPACGCGNFLIIAYRELRLLELEILKMKESYGQQRIAFAVADLLKVNVGQFYGIEIEEFPCQIAQTGLWLMDHLMNIKVSEEFGQYYVRLPLTHSATITRANALRIDWDSVIHKDELSYILGNPPFVGSKLMNEEQRDDARRVFIDEHGLQTKGAGVLDYVAAWYHRASRYIAGTSIRVAFVSTNSITQGEQAAAVWKPLFEMFDIHIDFAYRTFKWGNEAKGKAAVHCVIIGFSTAGDREKIIYDGAERVIAKNISPYLVDAPDVLVESRQTPLCDAPPIGIGNKPIDNGNYLFSETEKDEFLQKEPRAKKWFQPWIGSDEFINGYTRYCLWLGDCPPSELKLMPEAMKRVEAVRQFRLRSKSAPTRKLADAPIRFHVENMPKADCIVVPKVSSARRRYIPMGFLKANIIASDLLFLIPGSTLYHFGVLTSNVHNAWTRAVCGRLGMGYRYSKDIVYNNFPWPNATGKQKSEIEKLAKGVLDARAKYPDSSLADLYDPLAMPPELLKAHQRLDSAVMKLYGFAKDASEPAIVAELMELYQGLIKAAQL